MDYFINVKFDENSKAYYFKTTDPTIKSGDFVIVETVVGKEIGEVVGSVKDKADSSFELEIKPIIKKATEGDLKLNEENKKQASIASKVFIEEVQKLNLKMSLVHAQYVLDRTKILFSYVSSDRVDFRELLKVLAFKLKCRIELRQINIRERAQKVGGIGVCGLPLCCANFNSSFEGITMNRAKNQMLTINISKISGQCGKLMCCLKYEDDMYSEAKKEFPKIGDHFKYANKEYKVTGYNIFSKIVQIQSKEDGIEYMPLNEIKRKIH